MEGEKERVKENDSRRGRNERGRRNENDGRRDKRRETTNSAGAPGIHFA